MYIEPFILDCVLNSDVLHTAFIGVCVKSHMSDAVYIEVFVKL